MILVWMILLPIAVGLLCYLIPIGLGRIAAVLTHLFMLGLAGYLYMLLRTEDEMVLNVGGWPDYIGISLRVDHLGVIMVLLTALIFLAVSSFYLKAAYTDSKMIFLLLTMEGLITGIFLACDLFTIFILIEVSVLVISILIMYKKDSQAIYDGILYLLLNTVAMIFFVFGLAILYKMTGVLDIRGIYEQLGYLEDKKAIILPYAFILTAVSLKAALMPLFSWLPRAHGTPSAPSAVSAILSALYIKTGIYLFIRVQTMFSPVIDTSQLFLVLGCITALIGAVFALSQQDIKLLLAYSTVSQMGLVMMGINLGSVPAQMGAVYHLVSHSLFKVLLFLSAGLLIEEYKTREIGEIRGVIKRMPLTAAAIFTGLCGLTGAPFYNGSISKYWISYGAKGTWVEYALILINFATILYALKFGRMLFGNSGIARRAVQPSQKITVFLLCAGVLFSGLFGSALMQSLLSAELSFSWSEYMIKQLIYVGSLLGGLLVYGLRRRTRKIHMMIYEMELDFNGLCFMISLFFIFLIVYTHFMISAGLL
ncbi:MAG: complex I subunit 5 family protein [Lachnospiraceae bacterium]